MQYLLDVAATRCRLERHIIFDFPLVGVIYEASLIKGRGRLKSDCEFAILLFAISLDSEWQGEAWMGW
jgi:hypothetical protein